MPGVASGSPLQDRAVDHPAARTISFLGLTDKCISRSLPLNQGYTLGSFSAPHTCQYGGPRSGPFWRARSSKVSVGLAKVFLGFALQFSFFLCQSFALTPYRCGSLGIPPKLPAYESSSRGYFPREPDLRHVDTSSPGPHLIKSSAFLAVEF